MKKEIKLFEVPFISSVQEMIIRSGSVYKYKTAMEDYLESPISKVTYGELYSYIIKFGKALFALGLKERDHIALIGENRVQWGISYLTAMVFNFVIVPVDKSLSENEIINIIYESDSKALIFTESLQQTICEIKSSLTNVNHFISMDLSEDTVEFFAMIKMIENQNDQNERLPEISPADAAEIIFTSGSLGRAKGVMLSQKGIAENLMGMTKMIKVYPEDRFIAVLPIHHTYQCTCGFLCPLYTGASVHFTRSLKTILQDVQRSKATIMLGAPLLFNKIYAKIIRGISENKIKSKAVPILCVVSGLLNKTGWKNSKKIIFKELHQKFGGELRLLIAGGAAPDPAVSRGFRKFGFNFVQGYGLTETSPILTLNTIDNFKDEAAGLPLPNLEIKINNPDKHGIGEVYAKGENILIGYYKNTKLTQESFDKEWFKTGDLGFIDKDGFLHLSGRKKNVIIANNGENVYPEEIEDLLNRSPFIIESLVYGEKDEKHDEIIVAQLVTDNEVFIDHAEKTNNKLSSEFVEEVVSDEIKKINKELAPFKRIKKFYLRDKEFEKTTTQKIKRHLAQNNNSTVNSEI